jgi:hypothetical protein
VAVLLPVTPQFVLKGASPAAAGGSLSQLIRGAAILTIEDSTEKITRDHLDLVPVDHAAQTANAAFTSGRGQRGRRASAEAV